MAEQLKLSSSHSDHSTDNKHRFQVSSSSQLFRPFFPFQILQQFTIQTKSSFPFFLFHFTLFPSKNKKRLTYYKHTFASSFPSLLVLRSLYFLSLIIQHPFPRNLLRIIKIAHTRHKFRQVLVSNFVKRSRTQHNSAHLLSALQRFLLHGQIALPDPIAQHPRNLRRGLFNKKNQRHYIASNRFERALQSNGFVTVV